MPDWSEVFSPSTPILEIFVRGTVMYLAIFFIMRIAGKREGGVHSLSDLLVVVLVAEAAANGMAGDARGIADSVLLIVTIIGWSAGIDALAYHFPPLRPLLTSKPMPLIVDGRVNKRALRRESLHPEELLAELWLHGVTDVGEVARAYLEPNGMVSVIRAHEVEEEEPPEPRARG